MTSELNLTLWFTNLCVPSCILSFILISSIFFPIYAPVLIAWSPISIALLIIWSINEGCAFSFVPSNFSISKKSLLKGNVSKDELWFGVSIVLVSSVYWTRPLYRISSSLSSITIVPRFFKGFFWGLSSVMVRRGTYYFSGNKRPSS